MAFIAATGDTWYPSGGTGTGATTTAASSIFYGAAALKDHASGTLHAIIVSHAPVAPAGNGVSSVTVQGHDASTNTYIEVGIAGSVANNGGTTAVSNLDIKFTDGLSVTYVPGVANHDVAITLVYTVD